MIPTCTVQRSFNLLFGLLLSRFPTALAMSPLPPSPQAQPRIVASASATPPTFLRMLPSTPSSKLKSLPHQEATWLCLLFYLFVESNAPVVLAPCVAHCSIMHQRNVPTNRAANKLLNQTKQPTKKPQTLGRPRTNLLVYPPNLQTTQAATIGQRCCRIQAPGAVSDSCSLECIAFVFAQQVQNSILVSLCR